MLKKRGFSLVELVVVIMILGILAAIAAPNFLNTSKRAVDQSAIQTLQTVRSAIDMYYAEQAAFPGDAGTEADLKADLATYLKGAWPKCPVGASSSAATVDVVTTGTAALAGTGGTSGGWKYNKNTGEFIINLNTTTVLDSTKKYDAL